MLIKDINLSKNVPRQTLLDALKNEAGTIHITDIMAAFTHLKKESAYVQENYREEFDQAYIQSFLMRIKKIQDNNKQYEGFVNADELQEAIKILKEQQKLAELDHRQHMHFFKIYRIITLYTTFVMDEPVHPVGMPFPGGFEIKQKDGIYYCPVKESQKNNPGAVCGICIAEQDPDV
ncbi:DUF2115 domain-containing protein [Methanobacterium sp.]|jgi:uncharacterized protein (UPF0305 family)|uniref:DUF2115 domain-containing protein n=1 Tax=Methanobacterium sp. TaxID=2164 RepID=UPI00315990D9